MRPLFYFLMISFFVFFSCGQQKNKISRYDDISIVGKWHRFTMENGYSEFDIDSQYVVFFNQKAGRFKLAYKIENDSFIYLTHKYAAKITDFGDSIYLQGNDGTNATLYRFIEPDIPFDSIPDEKDSLSFDLYAQGFDKRLIREFEKAGIEFFDHSEVSNDTTLERLLNLKNH
jgi:hypothetical protein